MRSTVCLRTQNASALYFLTDWCQDAPAKLVYLLGSGEQPLRPRPVMAFRFCELLRCREQLVAQFGKTSLDSAEYLMFYCYHALYILE